ncbi:tetratricopeptide repeat protein [Hyalangium rubrum]|uniref:Tetratricopeptide repeat protein n=1 Tax=Hyalangium rubrum TaxID=3103134 RepID=A0ABU5HC08_9BACT|nr:tetratricopeptide repeat protein [Hyalangium sp. s54d21]MDY7230649.1 tetratricopeptide repeat protein [Hyalangium sp. s54d21]
MLGLGLLTGCKHGSSQERALGPQDQARVYLEQNQPTKALPLLEELHANAPDDLGVARALTEAQVKAGRADAWIAELQRRNGQNERAVNHYMLGLAYFSRASDAGAPAVAAFERAIALSPQEPEFHYRLGIAHLESEQYTAALAPLRRAAELAPERAGIRLPLAKALHRTGDSAGAVEALNAVVRASPTPGEVATARALMNQIADPFAAFPKAAEGKLEEGIRLLQELDIPQQAIVAFEEILQDYPDLAVVHALLGLAYQRLDDAGRAVDEFKQAIELAPRDGKNHFYLGELYLSRQRADAAREAFAKAVAFNPLLDGAWFRLGDLQLDRRDLPAAREAFRVLTGLQPDSVPARGKLALVYQLEGDYPAAERELRRVVEKDPENVEFTLRLGLLFTERALQARRPEDRRTASEEAEKWLQKVLEAQPDNAMASRALQQLKAQE